MNLEKLKNRYLQITIGLVYLWFGGLKFFSNLSPAEKLAMDTIDQLTNFLIPSNISIVLLAIWETTVGAFLLLNLQRKNTIRVTITHMLLTFSPLFFFPDMIFGDSILSLTLLGQYIVKNLIILGALGVLWAEVKEEGKLLKKTKAEPLEANPILAKLFRLREKFIIN